ncbi:hypothetical protein HYH02_000719 [Chlamydomonas schloesseri]|uniref:Uncharacterized protein n=1 Tax=Chlamydomonas schloesseri TaxID=2026947 RepID=A0A835WV58_9CHLO|nr:hypothetical protein HYH02_000719 [Chlamydomonas schloesseri]|eukprot:KAG2454888.1 hypothetical protein HYH02_000719 [Chlamydomonas schloesseri]
MPSLALQNCGLQAPCRRLGLRRIATGPVRVPTSYLPRNGTGSRRPAWVASAAATGKADDATASAAAASAAAAAEPTTDEEPVDADAAAEAEAKKSAAYSEDMQKKMGTTLTYRHEDGLNYNRILPDLIVGSCLQTVADVDHLYNKENVRTIFCLQEDPDMAYFNLDIKPIQARCAELGLKHVRFPIRDFDGFDLRRKLPKAVSRLARDHDPTTGTVYIHCTAGMGRAPATALAYMFWLRGYQLDAAYELLRGKRMCSPRIEAIRSATVDLLVGSDPVPVTIAVTRTGTTTDFKVAGLDVGWHQQLPLEREPGSSRLVLNRVLQPGKYAYKFVVDGNWTYSADHPTLQDGNNTNNYIEVLGREVPEHLQQAQLRLLQPGGDLTEEERAELRMMLCPWASHASLYGEPVGHEQQPDLTPMDFDDRLP